MRHVPMFESADAWFLRYKYVVAGEEHQGSARCHTLPPPPVGHEITVFVDPGRLKRSEYFDHSHVPATLIGYTLAILVGAALVGRTITAFASME